MHARSHHPLNTSNSLDRSFETNKSIHSPDFSALEDDDSPVFEHEITVQDSGQAKRVSVQVKMNPETVDMIMQLRRLSSYFADTDNLDEAYDNITPAQSPPTLIVSSSTESSLCSFNSIASEASGNHRVTVATTQLFTTSVDSKQCVGRGPMNLTEMIANLRSRCAPPRMATSTPVKMDGGKSGEPVASSPNHKDDSDDWAFADTLMDVYEESSFLSGIFQSEAGLETDASVTLGSLSSLDKQTLAFPKNLKVQEESARSFDQGNLHNESLPPPTSPLPSIPIPNLHPLKQVQHVRSILKPCKSVRFVSIPDSDSCTSSSVHPSAESSLDASDAVILPSAIVRKLSADFRGRASYTRARSAHNPQKLPTNRRASESAAVRPIAERAIPPLESKVTNPNYKGQLTVGRHSIGGAKSTKENRARSSSVPSTQIGDARASSLKSRMPVAVRNVLARFK